MAHKRLHKVRIDELSSVDRPAQEGALEVLVKRAPEDALSFAKGDLGMADPRLVTVADGHQHLLDLADGNSGRTTWDHAADAEYGHEHAWIRMPDGSVQVAMSEGHTHEVVGEAVAARDPGNPNPNHTPMTEAEKAEADRLRKEDQDRIAKLEKRLERSEAVAALPAEQRSHFDGLDADGQDAFLAKSTDERLALAKAAKDDDPVAYTTRDGEVIRKSAGSTVIGLAKRLDAERESTERLSKRLDDERLAKRATTELPNLPGSEDVKVAALRAFEGIADESLRKGAEDMLRAANQGASGAFQTAGTREGAASEGEPDPNEELDALAKAHMKANPGVGYYDAYDVVSEQNPTILEKALRA